MDLHMTTNMIKEQKQKVILRMLWLAHYNSKIDWRTEEVKIMRYLNKYGSSGDQSRKNQNVKVKREKILKKDNEYKEDNKEMGYLK